MQPEMPFIAAGATAIIGGVIKSHGWPANGDKALIGTVVLTVVASATADSQAAPLVHAIGMLLLLAAVMATVKSVQASKTKPTTKAKVT